nr:uncharacterized protein LOC103417557 [Malus domestica]
MVRERQQTKVMEAIRDYELPSGQGLNQETSLKRASDTRWGSHYGTLVSLVNMFSSVIEVLEMIVDDGVSLDQRGEADILLNLLQSFDFVSSLFLMKEILGITNVLSHALQKKDLDIVSAMALVKASRGRSRRRVENLTNLHHYRVDLFIDVIDKQLQELNNRFNETRINNLAQKLVETKRDRQYPLVYLLVKLALILPVATASVERAFSMMKIVKNPHRNRMGDQWLNDSLVVYIEKDVYDSISNDVVIRRFQNMRTRRGQL